MLWASPASGLALLASDPTPRPPCNAHLRHTPSLSLGPETRQEGGSNLPASAIAAAFKQTNEPSREGTFMPLPRPTARYLIGATILSALGAADHRLCAADPGLYGDFLPSPDPPADKVHWKSARSGMVGLVGSIPTSAKRHTSLRVRDGQMRERERELVSRSRRRRVQSGVATQHRCQPRAKSQVRYAQP